MRNGHSLFGKGTLWYGIISAAICIISRAFFESPLEMVHVVKGVHLLPPIWLYNLISYLLFFIIGIAAGAIIDYTSRYINGGSSAISAYCGGLFFISCFFTSIILYHVFFISKMLLLSLIVSATAMICSIICSIKWKDVQPSSSCVIMCLFSLWQFYMFFVCLSVFLNN